MSMNTYEKMMKKPEFYRELELSEKDVKAGRVYDAEESKKCKFM